MTTELIEIYNWASECRRVRILKMLGIKDKMIDKIIHDDYDFLPISIQNKISNYMGVVVE